MLSALFFTGCTEDGSSSRLTEKTENQPVRVYENGLWWTGDSFEKGERYVSGGSFIAPVTTEPTTRLDLNNAYVVPPLADAHSHGFDSPGYAVQMVNDFLEDGVFYAASLGNSASGRKETAYCLVGLDGMDILFANGMITASGAHPILSYEAQAAGVAPWRLSDEERTALLSAGTMQGDVYWIADTPADVDAFWAAYLGQGPDIVKIIIDSEAEAASQPGLLPETVSAINAAARKAGLPVFAHIQTEADVRIALEGGVDILAHAPRYSYPETPYNDDLLQQVKAAGIAITPTFARELGMERFVPEQYRKSAETAGKIRAAHAARLEQLSAAGVTVLTGYDLNDGTALDEMAYWQEVSDLPGTDILNASVIDTAKTLYPERMIGCLEAGCEASFIVTQDNPIEDITRIRQAIHRVRKGKELTLPLTDSCEASDD